MRDVFMCYICRNLQLLRIVMSLPSDPKLYPVQPKNSRKSYGNLRNANSKKVNTFSEPRLEATQGK